MPATGDESLSDESRQEQREGVTEAGGSRPEGVEGVRREGGMGIKWALVLPPIFYLIKN